MPITQALNSKANIKKQTSNDLPFAPQQPVIASYYATSTLNQTVINLTFSVDQALTDTFWLFVDGKKLDLGAGNDYTFTALAPDNTSSQITLNQLLAANLNIQAFKLGLKKESEFQTDNRFTALYEYLNDGFQGFVNPLETLIQPTTTPGTPAPGTFYSSITGRAPLTDLSQDLKPRMGIDRVMTQNIFEIQNEFGPAGERVFGTVNDTLGLIRFVGSWTQNNDNNGPRIGSGSTTTTDYCEVTFYGTGLNILVNTISGAGNDLRASVDGGAEGASFMPATQSTVLSVRNYSTNTLWNVVSGLTLGNHTVKIRAALTTSAQIFGFEILNESSSVKVQPGVGYVRGQRYVSSAQSAFSYSAPVTGTRGGRVLVYQNADGTIGKAFQAVGAQLNLTAADHTSEEILRTYFWREFGAGRADDFSSVVATLTDRAFTLDDGTTTLVGSQIRSQSSTPESLFHTGFSTITFVGTGLDIVRVDTGSTGTDTNSVTVDGVSIGNLNTSGSTTLRKEKIVSGLPYGTHTVKITRVSSVNWNMCITSWIIYGPKKPALPSGAVELSDYNVPADFAASTDGLETIAVGVLRKDVGVREAVYINGTGGTTDWQLIGITTTIGGWVNQSDRLNAQAKYTFFGTGFEYRFRNDSNVTNNVSVQINGLAATVANFPGLASAVHGPGVTFAAGVLNPFGSGSGQQGCGLTITGLPLGTYTLTLNNNVASSFMQFTALDIIAPIHSAKSNIYSDLQNTLPVGSCGISDNRKSTLVKDILPSTKAWAQAIGITGSPATTATAYVPLPDMSVVIKTSGGPIQIYFASRVYNSTVNNALFQLIAYVDGVQIPGSIIYDRDSTSNSIGKFVSNSIIVPVSAGSHKVDIYWLTQVGTIIAETAARILTVREI